MTERDPVTDEAWLRTTRSLPARYPLAPVAAHARWPAAGLRSTELHRFPGWAAGLGPGRWGYNPGTGKPTLILLLNTVHTDPNFPSHVGLRRLRAVPGRASR